MRYLLLLIYYKSLLAIKYGGLKDETVLVYIPVAESTPIGASD